jgi:hypothetical protein
LDVVRELGEVEAFAPSNRNSTCAYGKATDLKLRHPSRGERILEKMQARYKSSVVESMENGENYNSLLTIFGLR